jgi:hypothetical protein
MPFQYHSGHPTLLQGDGRWQNKSNNNDHNSGSFWSHGRSVICEKQIQGYTLKFPFIFPFLFLAELFYEHLQALKLPQQRKIVYEQFNLVHRTLKEISNAVELFKGNLYPKIIQIFNILTFFLILKHLVY